MVMLLDSYPLERPIDASMVAQKWRIDEHHADELPANGLPISRAALLDRESCRADSSLQNSSDLGAAKRRRLHPTITAGRDSPLDDRSPSYPISCVEAACHHHGRVSPRTD